MCWRLTSCCNRSSTNACGRVRRTRALPIPLGQSVRPRVDRVAFPMCSNLWPRSGRSSIDHCVSSESGTLPNGSALLVLLLKLGSPAAIRKTRRPARGSSPNPMRQNRCCPPSDHAIPTLVFWWTRGRRGCPAMAYPRLYSAWRSAKAAGLLKSACPLPSPGIMRVIHVSRDHVSVAVTHDIATSHASSFLVIAHSL